MKPASPEPAEPVRSCLLAPGRIEDLLMYQLTRLTRAAGAAVIRLCEGKYGISRREWHIVALLGAHGGHAPSELADMAHLDRARISRALTLLREKGFVSRVARHGDHRRAIVELTASGHRLYAQLFAEVAEINVTLVRAVDAHVLPDFEATLAQLQARAEVLAREAVTDVHAARWKGVGQRSRWLDDQDVND